MATYEFESIGAFRDREQELAALGHVVRQATNAERSRSTDAGASASRGSSGRSRTAARRTSSWPRPATWPTSWRPSQASSSGMVNVPTPGPRDVLPPALSAGSRRTPARDHRRAPEPHPGRPVASVDPAQGHGGGGGRLDAQAYRHRQPCRHDGTAARGARTPPRPTPAPARPPARLLGGRLVLGEGPADRAADGIRHGRWNAALPHRARRGSDPVARLADLSLDPLGALFDEPRAVLGQELEAPAVYFSLLSALAAGPAGYGDIQRRSRVDYDKVGRYLATLEALGLVTPALPGYRPAAREPRAGSTR